MACKIPAPVNDKSFLWTAHEESQARDIHQGVLLAALDDMEEAFLQLHHRFLLLKQSAHDCPHVASKGVAWKKETVTEEQGSQDDNDKKNHLGLDKESTNMESTTEVVSVTSPSDIDEPTPLKLHRSNYQQEAEARRTAEAHIVIRANAFGRNAEHRNDFRLNPEWMELTTKSMRALESSMSEKKRSAQSVIHVTVNSSKTSVSKQLSKQLSRQDTKITLIKVSWHERIAMVFTPVPPHALTRMTWDVAGCVMLILDAFLLPLTLAWDMELSSTTGGYMFLWLSLFFWTTDMIGNFNTGFYRNGTLHLSRTEIVKNYIAGWFVFDLLIVSLDFVLAIMRPGSETTRMASALRSFRALRALRAVRLLRLVKMRKFNAIIEEAALATGRPWLLIVISMFKILLGMLFAAHGLSCVWYFIGYSVHNSGRVSWLENSGATQVGVVVQYLHALQWLLTPPAPAPIDPASLEERVGNICIVVFTLIVMGSALGKFTSALQELNAINSETSRKRREIRSYLQENATSTELISRIMRFVDHKLLLRDASGAVDLSLISPTLQMELYVNQRSSFLEVHPLFLLTKEIYPTVYAYICGAAIKHGYERLEIIFQQGQFANTMIITAVGDYTLQKETDPLMRSSDSFGRIDSDMSSIESEDQQFSGVRWFGESSIYSEGQIHSLTLRADTFCDAFTLTSKQLRVALQDSPAAAYMFCEYAKDFLSALKQCKDPTDYEQAEGVVQKAIRQNQSYMILYPDARSSIELFGQSGIKSDDHGLEANYSDAKLFIEQAVMGDIADQKILSAGLQTIFFELDPENGSHATFSQKGERDRSHSSCLSILNLVADQYENFTDPQNAGVRLTMPQWQELRDIIKWIAPTPEEVHAVVVLLAIRSLGKSKRLVQQLPRRNQRPEAAVIYVIEYVQNVVPSVRELDAANYELIIETLQVNEKFNFAQMMQGENCPANILQLKEIIGEKVALFKFYILFFLGFMSGLAAGEGSRFMTSKNAENIIFGCRALRCLMSTSPQAIYWKYMMERARVLSIPTETPEELALVRLACLSRVQDYSGYESLRAAWMSISVRSRKVLLQHFLADGITERAFVLEFLPLCIGNATNNPAVRLPAMLEVIVDLLDNLAPSIHTSGSMLLTVDLSDLAEFVSVVKNRFIFQSSIMRSDVRTSDGRICIGMSLANWNRTQDAETDMTALAHDVKAILDRLEFVERNLGSEPVAKRNALMVPAKRLKNHSYMEV